MKKTKTHILLKVLGAAFLGAGLAHAAAPSNPQGLITAKAFLNVSGTGVASLTNSASFPNSPSVIQFPTYFEWAATGDISTPPGNWADNYGAQIVGYFYPPSSGDYIFYICSDDNSELYLSTDSNPANKKLIARESAYSNPRQYTESAGSSDLTMKDSSQFAATQWPTKDAGTGLAKITLQAGKPYYIEALSKDGGGGDNLSVAVLDPGLTIDSTMPIPGKYLSSDNGEGPVAILIQPKNQSIDERASVTFNVAATGTPPFSFQWKRNGADISDATNVSYTMPSVASADNSAKYSVVITGTQGTVTSQDAVLTVVPDTVAPKLLNAKGSASLTEVTLTFSENITQASATVLANYSISSASGSLAVSAATLSPGGAVITLTTAQQKLGSKYSVIVNNLKDIAANPNTIAANSKAVFFPMGKLVEKNGFIVFEAENYDRNLDGLWIANTTRGTPSGGVSMVNPNGAGGSENATKLEYEVEFKQAATYVVWYRASADNGNDDSSWLHLDGERPAERATGNQASMSGFQPQTDFVWRSDAQDPPDPFTIDIANPGMHVIGLARREDGAVFDKFLLTTDRAYTPTGFGPPETRDGVPAAPAVAITAPGANQKFASGGSVVLTANASGDLGLEIVRVEFTANGAVIGEATTAPFGFTWKNLKDGIYAIRAKATDEMGVSTTSGSVVVEVGTPPPQALLVVGTVSIPTLNASDAGIKSRLESKGWQVTDIQAPVSTTANADGKQLVIVSSTVASGDVGDKFRNVTAPVIMWEQAVQDNFLTTLDTATDRGTLAGQTQINIVKTDHPLAAGLSTGVKAVTKEAQDYSWGVPNKNAVVVATIADNPNQAAIYGYDKGAILIDGATPAPARRVLFFSGDNSFAAFTDEGIQLFDAAVEWASGIKPQKPSSANIAWVSFHSGDAAPTSAAATAGFTKAADVAYTDLLKANGHNIARVVTSGTPDKALLNAFDLVIISRCVPSGDYQDPLETAAWNGITAPTMILGGYVLRNSRLGFTTGATIPDTAGPVRLTVNDPSHPVFAGISLDANKTMVNLYADVVMFNGTVQRGISVNTDPVAGNGTILATISASTDPAFGGMVIGEWQANAALGNAASDKLGGHRLVFLTGSREVSGLTSEGSGIYDLSPDGAKLFLNAVNYMAGTEPRPVVTQPTLSMTRSGSSISITFTGILQSADTINGPWSDVANASSPVTISPSGAQKFYRAKN